VAGERMVGAEAEKQQGSGRSVQEATFLAVGPDGRGYREKGKDPSFVQASAGQRLASFERERGTGVTQVPFGRVWSEAFRWGVFGRKVVFFLAFSISRGEADQPEKEGDFGAITLKMAATWGGNGKTKYEKVGKEDGGACRV